MILPYDFTVVSKLLLRKARVLSHRIANDTRREGIVACCLLLKLELEASLLSDATEEVMLRLCVKELTSAEHSSSHCGLATGKKREEPGTARDNVVADHCG